MAGWNRRARSAPHDSVVTNKQSLGSVQSRWLGCALAIWSCVSSAGTIDACALSELVAKPR